MSAVVAVTSLYVARQPEVVGRRSYATSPTGNQKLSKTPANSTVTLATIKVSFNLF